MAAPEPTLPEIMNLFDPRYPLAMDQLDSYYVARPHAPLEPMKTYLKVTNQPAKVLFCGHRGSGKSTELMRLAKDLENEFFVVRFSARSLNLADLNYVDILLSREGINEIDDPHPVVLVIPSEMVSQLSQHGLGDPNTVRRVHRRLQVGRLGVELIAHIEDCDEVGGIDVEAFTGQRTGLAILRRGLARASAYHAGSDRLPKPNPPALRHYHLGPGEFPTRSAVAHRPCVAPLLARPPYSPQPQLCPRPP